MSAPQEVTSLSVKDFKGVKEISLKPHGALVVIAGANGSGKSSFIDAFVEMFDPKGIRLTPKPIRDGADEARAELTTTEARLVRTWKENGPGTLTAYALDGAKYPSGKDFVLAATGGALFDPQAFIGMAEKDQRAALLERVKLPFDLATLDRERAGVFEQRSDVNRVVKQLEGSLATFGEPVEGTPVVEVSAAEIIAEHDAARAHNDRIHKEVDNSARLQSAYEAADADVERFRAALKMAESKAAEAHERYDTHHAMLLELPELIDTNAITAKLTELEATNAKVRAAAEYRRTSETLAVKREEAARFTLKLAEIDKTKADALAAAKFPVDGLSVDDDGITFEGIPFKQINTAMKTTIAFDLATSAKPDLRLIVVKDGDLLDHDSLAGIEALATERGYIVLVERDRDESREIGFTITDGELSA